MALKRDRKIFLINPKFQLGFVSQVFLHASLTITIFYFSDVYYFWKIRKQAELMGLKPGNVFFDFVQEQQMHKAWIYVWAAGLSLSVLIWFALRMSHRIAGPLYRLKMAMLKTASGKRIKKLHFREKDYFLELSDAFNEMNDQNKTDVSKEKDAA